MSGPLSGKVALVTGASSGIGRAAAIQLAQAGADVALNYLTMPEGAEAAAREIEKLGRRARLYRVDISDQAAVEQMVSDAVSKLGRMDVYVSSAVFSEREVCLSLPTTSLSLSATALVSSRRRAKAPS